MNEINRKMNRNIKKRIVKSQPSKRRKAEQHKFSSENKDGYTSRLLHYINYIQSEINKATGFVSKANEVISDLGNEKKETKKIDFKYSIANNFHLASVHYESALRYVAYLKLDVRKELIRILQSEKDLNIDIITKKYWELSKNSGRWFLDTADSITYLLNKKTSEILKEKINEKSLRVILPEIYGQAINKYIGLYHSLIKPDNIYYAFVRQFYHDDNKDEIFNFIINRYSDAKNAFVELANLFSATKDEFWKEATAYANAGDCLFSIYLLKKQNNYIDDKNLLKKTLFFYKKAAEIIETNSQPGEEWIRIEWPPALNEIGEFFKDEKGNSIGNFRRRVQVFIEKFGGDIDE